MRIISTAVVSDETGGLIGIVAFAGGGGVGLAVVEADPPFLHSNSKGFSDWAKPAKESPVRKTVAIRLARIGRQN
jgi:hypothetical protein